MQTIGIDIGTTTISAVAFDTDTQTVLESKTVKNNSFLASERSWEKLQDAETICRTTQEVLDGLLDTWPQTAGIGLTGQMHGIVYTDGKGCCVSPLYTWQDQRGNREEEGGRTICGEIADKCGRAVPPGYGLATHLYNQRHGLLPDAARKLCTISDYFGMRLTGRKSPLVHTGNAASLGLFDVKEGRFCSQELLALGADLSILPEVTEEVKRLGFYKTIPVKVAIGDNQASFLGAVGEKEHTLLVNMGTGGQISLLSRQYFEGSGIEARPFLHGSFLLVGASLCGGRAYAVLEQFFRSFLKASEGISKSQYPVMDFLAQRAAQRAGEQNRQERLKIRTTFSGTRANPDLRGAICGISEENFTPENLICGVLEGMAEELWELYQKIYRGTGIRVERLVASGNGLRLNPALQRLFRDRFGAQMEEAACTEEAACGAAKIAAKMQ